MKSNVRGFTIIELLMAMAVFSFVMVIIVAAFMQLMSGYRQGVTNQKTQNLNREILVQMTRAAHDSSTLTVSADNSHVCFGDSQYDYDQTNGNLYLGERSANCSSVAANRKNLISDDLKVLKFVVDPRSSSNTANPVVLGANVELTIATRNEDLLDDSGQACDPTKAGSQYCSITTIKTAVGLRGE